ncbi:MAG: DUF6502 family protein [Woeseiaceae bacterium]|nr:DUF6502 family protein [Woeseiaceae bacterium]
MTPLVRILLRNGISFREFAEVVKDVFVAVCARDLVIPGRRLSISRIAIVTGLTRKEVSAIVRDDELRRKALETNANRAAKILEAWHSDTRFLGPYGFPRDLLIEGDDPSGTFSDLVRENSGDMPVRAMLDELSRVGASRVLEGGEIVRVLKRTYIPTEMTPEMIQIFSQAVRRYIETVDYNLSLEDTKGRRFDRGVYPDPGLRVIDLPAYQQEVREYLETVIAEIDYKTSAYQRPDDQDSERTTSIGVGIYFYHDEVEDKRSLVELLGKSGIDDMSEI